jgi:hypothetical protein
VVHVLGGADDVLPQHAAGSGDEDAHAQMIARSPI